jgi:hypothetical protein
VWPGGLRRDGEATTLAYADGKAIGTFFSLQPYVDDKAIGTFFLIFTPMPSFFFFF